jgi:Tfp pilus assembly protein PilN
MSAEVLEQQVNLYQPIMGAHRRLFSARAMAGSLLLLITALGGIAGYTAHRTAHIERTIAELQKRETANLDAAGRAAATLRPAQSLPQLDAEAKRLTAEIEVRQRAIAAVQSTIEDPAHSFAARLEALARRHVDGLWLKEIVADLGEGQLALRGFTSNPELVPTYLSGLSAEPALAGVRFDQIAIRRATAEEAPAAAVFELDGPKLVIGEEEHKP